MADQVINLTIPSEKVATALQGFLKIYPNVEKNEDGSPKYVNDKAWVQERIRRNLVRDIRRGLQIIENENSIIPIDDTIAT